MGARGRRGAPQETDCRLRRSSERAVRPTSVANTLSVSVSENVGCSAMRLQLLEVLHPPASKCNRDVSYGVYDGESKMWVARGCSGRFLCDGWGPLFCGSWLAHGTKDWWMTRAEGGRASSSAANCTCGETPRRTPSLPRPLHVAHLIVGQLRGFLDPRVLHSLRTDVIEAAGGVAEAFVLVKPHACVNRSAVAAAAHQLGVPTVLRLRANDSDESAMATVSCLRLISYEQHFLAASTDRREAFDMALARERERGAPFDLFVRVRPDEFFCDRFPRFDSIDWRLYHRTVATFQAMAIPGIADHVAVLTRAVATIYFESHRAFGVCDHADGRRFPRALYSGCYHYHAATNSSAKFVPAECIQLRWLEEQGVGHDNGAAFGPPRSCMVDERNRLRRCTARRETWSVWAKTTFWTSSIQRCARMNGSMATVA